MFPCRHRQIANGLENKYPYHSLLRFYKVSEYTAGMPVRVLTIAVSLILLVLLIAIAGHAMGSAYYLFFPGRRRGLHNFAMVLLLVHPAWQLEFSSR